MEHSAPSGSTSSASAPKKKPYAFKKESEHKKETRSRHEKKRREEMNQVFAEMMSLLPEDVQDAVFKLQHVNHKPKKPDKCFIISNAVEFIKKNVKKTINLKDSLTQEAYNLTNCFVLTMKNMVLESIEGDHKAVFCVDKNKMLGKDLRGFLDFESARKLSFFKPEHYLQLLTLRSFMTKQMTCKLKQSEQNPAELIMVCVPEEPPAPPPSPPPSKMEEEQPILAALLRRKEPKASTSGNSNSFFIDPPKSSGEELPPLPPPPPKKAPAKPAEKTKRKRLRSMNAIVESYSLDDDSADKKKMRKIIKAPAPAPAPVLAPEVVTAPPPAMAPVLTTFPSPPQPTLATLLSTPVTIPTTSFINPIISPAVPSLNLNPYDILAPNYKDIWLRLQSERLLLEERISAKEGELKTLMLTSPQYFPTNLTTIPQYNLPFHQL